MKRDWLMDQRHGGMFRIEASIGSMRLSGMPHKQRINETQILIMGFPGFGKTIFVLLMRRGAFF
jgi:hypothetical protein